MRNDEFFMRQAIKQAQKAYELLEVPVGCVLVKDNKIIASAYNKREHKQSSLAHAEMLAIAKASKKLHNWVLEDVTMYVTLEPCLMCTGAIFQSRLKRVVYGAKEPKFGVLGSLMDLSQETRFNHRIEVSSGLFQDEISQMMKDFFKQLRSTT
ncbi:MAG TPA: tRNA adenosine(34) deaminase TadA [Bacilli bacterium]|nr:tRNA adenosine(34) deaminase TadA [Bacilli bacterium]HPN60902.1 tRNA adenosine(34) deaminase TadA [Bacilli bacterium]HPX84184.1 tRNA adenosine(34) deaminase TadA [Bacilli bacterium]HQC74224.1 tRNA adenosine(34) deaminase TadA [Bacilli bacterium]